MRAILYQIAEATGEGSSRGVPAWVVWALVGVIVLLVVFILIRDKRSRKALKNFFVWIADKIRVVRLKSQMGKKEQERSGLMTELGRTAWEKQIENPEIATDRQEITNLKKDEASLTAQIEKMDNDIQRLREKGERDDQAQKSKISEIEKEKAPLEKQHKELVGEKDKIESRIKEDEKSLEKITKSIENHKREIEKTDRDGYLSKIEKEMKRKEHKREIENLETRLPQNKERLTRSKEDRKKILKNIGDLETEIKTHDDRLDALKKEWRERQKKDEEEISGIQKNRKALGIKRIGIRKEITSLFETIGEKLDRNRIDHDDLKPVYSRIDQIDKTMKDLQEKIDRKTGK